MTNEAKEALENLVHCKSITKCKECKHKSHCTIERDYNIIKQSLERLEQVEKENQELAETLELYNEKFAGHERERADLIKENQELKAKCKDLMLDFKMFDFNTLKQENEKLKKAIDILKNKRVDVDILLCSETLEEFNDGYHEEYRLTQEEYDLLKEVLSDGK